ncbi:MAG: DNA topology modulation protein FlaR [Cohaesibacter sp.]|nr:DNA topology modulation protein FlaR [Cohaesibacter sp.]
MKRIVIIGCAGAGKSTLAQKLSPIFEIPIIHMDQHFWMQGWVQKQETEFQKEILELIKTDSWIMDGNYGETLPARLERADLLIYLDFPRWLCLYRVFKRIAFGYGKTRSDMAKGCPEQISWDFIQWIWTFQKRSGPKLQKHFDDFKGPKHQLKKPVAVRAFLKSLHS